MFHSQTNIWSNTNTQMFTDWTAAIFHGNYQQNKRQNKTIWDEYLYCKTRYTEDEGNIIESVTKNEGMQRTWIWDK